MTGLELKAHIFRYLESRGWKNLHPGEYYAWDSPQDPKVAGDRQFTRHYCWPAALVVAMADEEGTIPTLPPHSFKLINGGRGATTEMRSIPKTP